MLSLSLLTHLPTYQPTYLSYPIPVALSSPQRNDIGRSSSHSRPAVRAAGTLSPLLSRSDGSSLLVESSVSSGRFSRRFSLSVSPTISTSRCRGLTRYKHVYGHSPRAVIRLSPFISLPFALANEKQRVAVALARPAAHMPVDSFAPSPRPPRLRPRDHISPFLSLAIDTASSPRRSFGVRSLSVHLSL